MKKSFIFLRPDYHTLEVEVEMLKYRSVYMIESVIQYVF